MHTATLLWALFTPPLVIAAFLAGYCRGLGSIRIFSFRQYTVDGSWFHTDRTVTDHTVVLAGGKIIHGSFEYQSHSSNELSKLFDVSCKLIGCTTGQRYLPVVLSWARRFLGIKEEN